MSDEEGKRDVPPPPLTPPHPGTGTGSTATVGQGQPVDRQDSQGGIRSANIFGGATSAGIPSVGIGAVAPRWSDPRPPKLDLSSAPKMTGSFDLYEVQLRKFLRRMKLWSVVDGSYRNDPQGMIDFKDKDNEASEVILAGVPKEDAEMICMAGSAEEMWKRFVDRRTKREFPNYIFAFHEYYSNQYTTEKTMEQWLKEMEVLRRKLAHFNMKLSDAQHAETLLAHVAITHRDLVRQFNRSFDARGGERPVLDLTQVMNALMSESALDERAASAGYAKPAQISSCGRSPDAPAQPKPTQHQGKGKKFKGKGRYKQKQGKKTETRSCHLCDEVGHLMANCPNKKKDKVDKPEISEFKRWQSHKWTDGETDKRGRKRVSALCCLVRDEVVATSKAKKTLAGYEMDWILDSASDVHVCNQREVLHNLRTDKSHVFQGSDGETRSDERVGDVSLRVKNNKSPRAEMTLPFKNVLFSSSAPDNLLSLDKLESEGWQVKFGLTNTERVCWLRKEHVELLLAKSRRRYRLKASAATVYVVNSLQSETEHIEDRPPAPREPTRGDAASLERWHLRYAHLCYNTLQQMARNEVADGMSELRNKIDVPCWTCKAAKMTRMSYKNTGTRRAVRPYQKLMSDECYVGVTTYDGFKHFQLVLDEASRYLWGLLLHRKEDSNEVVLRHLQWLVAQGHHIEAFGSDQGRELLNKATKAFLEANGIEYIWTNAYSPEENGLVEKMNGTVMARVRCLLSAANMPMILWGEAFRFVVNEINISASAALGGDTPNCRRFGLKPDVSTLRTWGCLVFVFTPKVLRANKLENPGKPGLFVGYGDHSESYRIMNLTSGNVNEVRSVKFQEAWTVERSYVEKLLSNRYGGGRNVLSTVIPFVQLPVLRAVSCESKREAVESEGRLPKRHRSDSLPISADSTEVGGEPLTFGTGAPGQWMRSGGEVPARSAEAQTRPIPEGTTQLSENTARIVIFERNGNEGGVGDSPNSSRANTAAQSLHEEDSSSVGDVDGGETPDDTGRAACTELDDTEEDAIAFGEPTDLMDQLAAYDDLRSSGSDSDENEDVETDGWRGAGASTSFRTTSFRRSSRVRHPNVRLQDYEIDIQRVW